MFNYINIINKKNILISAFFTNYFKFFFTLNGFFNKKLFFYTLCNLYFTNRKFFSYTGKIFRLRLYKKKIKFSFNRSHRLYLYFFKKIFLKKLSKKRFKIMFFYNRDMFNLKNIFNKIRDLNIYTHRGIKYSHCFYNKKKGKISAYKKVM